MTRSISRSAARLAAVQALYQQEMEGTPTARLIHEFHDHRLGATIEGETYAEAEISFFDDLVSGHAGAPRGDRRADRRRLAEGWSLDRLDKPMKAILRVGAYELIARPTCRWRRHQRISRRRRRLLRQAREGLRQRPARRHRQGCAAGRLGSFRPSRSGHKRRHERHGRTRLHRPVAAARDRPAARGLDDDVAVIGDLVLTHDMIAEGVHFLPADPPASVGWKLVAVNLSDLAAKGAEPHRRPDGRDPDRRQRLGGEVPERRRGGLRDLWVARWSAATPSPCRKGAPRVLGLTADRPGRRIPSRSGGRPAMRCGWSERLGDAAAGLLALLQGRRRSRGPIGRGLSPAGAPAGRRPLLAPHATAMMDVSDGLLLDLSRLCAASRCGADRPRCLPLSRPIIAERGGHRGAAVSAATGGDDYALLAAIPAGFRPVSLSLPRGRSCPHRHADEGEGLSLFDAAGECRCRSSLVMNIALSTRQWIIALLGLASGMATALLLN